MKTNLKPKKHVLVCLNETGLRFLYIKPFNVRKFLTLFLPNLLILLALKFVK